MTQHLHNNAGWHALGQQECCARVPQVMEATLRKARVVKQFMELVGDDSAVQWLTVRARKHQIQFIPRSTRVTALNVLPVSVSSEGLCDRGRHHDRPPTSRRFRFNQTKHPVLSLQLFVHSDIAKLQVDVSPTKAKSFALACQRRRRVCGTRWRTSRGSPAGSRDAGRYMSCELPTLLYQMSPALRQQVLA